MDPPLDPPPLPTQPAALLPATAAPSANPTPTLPAIHQHPPYAEMITAAITALNERHGSSKRAIAKYIETNFSGLPPTHGGLLTHHLKRLKSSGQIVMVKHSYALPRSAPVVANGSLNAVPSDPAAAVPKRRPGRPPKVKPEAGQAAVPVFAAPVMDSVPGAVTVVQQQPLLNVTGPVNGPVRGRGRPPKRGGLKRGPGRPPKSGGVIAAGNSGGAMGRGRGRPKRIAVVPAAIAARLRAPGRPRGRPPKPINVVAEGVPVGGGVAGAPVAVGVAPVAPVAGKRRGRPPKAGGAAKRPRVLASVQPRKPRRLSGKPLGRPRKNASATGTQAPESQLLAAYLDLKAKLDNLQSRVKQTATVIKPLLNNEAAINALQELELAATTNVNAPPNVQGQQQQQSQLDQPPQPQS